MMQKFHEPLLLLDNETMSVIGAGDYKSTNMTFEEAKAIIEMYSEDEVIRCFSGNGIENVIYDYLGLERKNYVYKKFRTMHVGQDAIAFKLYITPSEAQTLIMTNLGVEAKKIQNIYVYCQHITRIS